MSSKKKTRADSIAEILRNFDALPDSKLLRTDVIAAHLDACKATVYRKSKAGALPPIVGGRIRLGDYRRAIASK